MRLWVGLGNPEPQMARNRHNIGFMALDTIAIRHGFSPWRQRFKGLTAEGVVGGEDKAWLIALLDAVADAAGLLAQGKHKDFMSAVALKTQEFR